MMLGAIAAALGGFADGSMLREDREFQRQRRNAAIELEQMQLDRARALRAAEQEIAGKDYNLPAVTRTIRAPDLTSMSEIPPLVERTVQVRPEGVDRVAQMRDAARLARLSGDYKGALELDMKSEELPDAMAKRHLSRAQQALQLGNPEAAVPHIRAAFSMFPGNDTLTDFQFDPQTGRFYTQTIDNNTGEPLPLLSFSVAEAGDLLTKMTDPKLWLDQRKHQRELLKDERDWVKKQHDMGVNEAELQLKGSRLQHDVWRDVQQLGINRGHLNVAQQRALTEASRVADQLNDMKIRVVDLGDRKQFYSEKTGRVVRAEDIGVSPDTLARIEADESIKSKEDFSKAIQTEIAVLSATRALRYAELGMDPDIIPDRNKNPEAFAKWMAAAQDATTHQMLVMLNRGRATLGELSGPAYVYAAWKDPNRRAEAYELARRHGLRIGAGGQLFDEVPQPDGTILRRAITSTGRPVVLDVIRAAPARGAMQLPVPDPALPLTGSPFQIPVPRPPRGPAIDLTSQIPR